MREHNPSPKSEHSIQCDAFVVDVLCVDTCVRVLRCKLLDCHLHNFTRDKSGQILAQVLLSRQHGHRPVVLLGSSCGARLIFSCLEMLADAPDGTGRGIVDSAFLLGAPVDISPERWAKARSVVAFRLVNGAPVTVIFTVRIFR